MEFVRRPAVLAALAAALLVVNIVVIATDAADGGGDEDDLVTIQEFMGNGADESEDSDGDTSEDPSDGAGDASDTDDASDTGDGADEGGADDDAGDAEGADDTTDEAAAGGDTTGDDATDQDATDATDDDTTAVAAPVSGTYDYASSGDWSLTGGATPEEYQLPATATGRVTSSGDGWTIELVAGQRYADRFGFTIGADGGLDWDLWELDRTFAAGSSTTVYACAGDSAYYRPDADAGRTAGHGCETTGITSEGTVEHVGSEDIALGDGTVVAADHLAYTYTVSGDGVSGSGRLDLWVDPATGLRVLERRLIETTTTAGAREFEYREDVEFLLQSLQPAT